jgi:hypothetical protein
MFYILDWKLEPYVLAIAHGPTLIVRYMRAAPKRLPWQEVYE